MGGDFEGIDHLTPWLASGRYSLLVLTLVRNRTRAAASVFVLGLARPRQADLGLALPYLAELGLALLGLA